jgi:hypothetical protein
VPESLSSTLVDVRDEGGHIPLGIDATQP